MGCEGVTEGGPLFGVEVEGGEDVGSGVGAGVGLEEVEGVVEGVVGSGWFGGLGLEALEAAVRLVEISRDPYLVVFSKDSKVQWSQQSSRLSDVWLERRQPIDQDSLAWAAAQGASPARRPQQVRPEIWFGHLKQCARLQVLEQSMLLGNYSTVVTILSCLEHENEC
ncbi:MAG: hypothetical protein ACC655_05420 [Rhodothermia bacterium]